MTIVSRPEDHKRENGSIVANEEHDTCDELSWVDRLDLPAFVLDDRNLRVISWNTKMEDITGISAQRIRSYSINSILDVGSTQRLTAALPVVIASGQSYGCNVCLLESGMRLFLNMTIHRSSHKKAVHIVCFGELRRMKTLKTTEILVQSNFPMASIDSYGQITQWNSSLQTLTGYPMNDVVGRCFFDFVPKRDHQKKLRNTVSFAVTSPHGSNCCIDFGIRNGDLKTMHVHVSTEISHDPDDNTTHYLILSDASDIGEQDDCETASSTSALHISPSPAVQQEWSQFIDDANIAIFGIDTTGKVNEWNLEAAETTGIGRADAIGKDLIANFISSDLRLTMTEVLQNALHGRGTSNFELEIRTKSGETRYLLASVSPRRDPDNDLVGAIIFSQDITESSKHDRAVVSMANELRKLIDTANAPIFGIDKDG